MGILTLIDGELDLHSVESLSTDELRQWIYNRLHGQDHALPCDLRDIDLPHYLISSVYSDINLDREVRRDISSIVLEFVHDLARNPNTDWNGDAADELLLLAQSTCDDNIFPDLEDMATQPERDIYYRVLQSLIALQWRGTIDFWQQQALRNPSEYAGLAFDGLSIIDATPAIELLTTIPWTEEVEDKILTALPGFINQYKASVVVPLFKQYFARMSQEAKQALESFFSEEGISVSTPIALSKEIDRSKLYQFLSKNLVGDNSNNRFQPSHAKLANSYGFS